jgi:hypothetical protein
MIEPVKVRRVRITGVFIVKRLFYGIRKIYERYTGISEEGDILNRQRIFNFAA